MKKRNTWMLVVGIIVAVAGIGSFASSSVPAGIIFLIMGAALIVLYFVVPRKQKLTPMKRFCEFKVAGVSFSNDKGRDRQAIIKEIKAGKSVQISLKPYQFKGKPAIGVYADGEQLGNVPADTVDEVQSFLKSYNVTEYKVLGSGKDAPFGFLVRIEEGKV